MIESIDRSYYRAQKGKLWDRGKNEENFLLEEKLTFSISESERGIREKKMFELITMEDDIKITPSRFNEDIEKAVTSELNQKLSNKGKGWFFEGKFHGSNLSLNYVT